MIAVLNKLDKREQTLLFGGLFVLIFILLFNFAEPVIAIFDIQRKEIKRYQDYLAALPNQIERYRQLSKIRGQIDTTFSGQNFEQGIQTFLEENIKNKGIPATDFNISPLPEKKFGGIYIQEPYRIILQKITSLPDLAGLLTDFTKKESSLIITRLDIKKANDDSKLTVEIDLSNFRKK